MPVRPAAAPSPRDSLTRPRVPPKSTATRQRRMPPPSPRLLLADRGYCGHLHPAAGLEFTATDDRARRAMIAEAARAGCIDAGPGVTRIHEHMQRHHQAETAAGSREG